jgi:uncharacterized protein YciI
MLVHVTCHDRPDSAPERARLMPEHGAYIAPHLDSFQIAGWAKDGDRVVASIIIMEAKSPEAARAIFEADPYFGAVWERIEAVEFAATAGTWIGGKTW